jgi:drug/metabolite transporter (DMT)-like permease
LLRRAAGSGIIAAWIHLICARRTESLLFESPSSLAGSSAPFTRTTDMSRLQGGLLVALSAFGFSTLGIFARYAYGAGADAMTILALRFIPAALILLAVLAARGERLPSGRILWQLCGMGGIGYVGQAFCYLTAVRYASPGLVSLLLYLYPVIVALVSALLFHERLTLPKCVSLALALTGLAITVQPSGGELPGVILGIAAAVIYSAYILAGAQVLRRVSAFQSSAVIFASAGAVSSVLALVEGPHLPSGWMGWAAVSGMAIFATTLPAVAFLAGMGRIGAPNAALLSTSEPLLTVLLSAWFLGDHLAPITLLGGALILAAVLLLSAAELRPAGAAELPADPVREKV